MEWEEDTCRHKAPAALLFVQYAGAHECVAHGVGVAVGRRPTVLEITLLLLSDSARYSDAASTVRDSCQQKPGSVHQLVEQSAHVLCPNICSSRSSTHDATAIAAIAVLR